MLGENLKAKKCHILAAGKLSGLMVPGIRAKGDRCSACIFGESGAGKSVIASELQKFLEGSGFRTFLLQQDDYFKHPPLTNYRLRREDLSRVGTSEVDLELLQSHLDKFLSGSQETIAKPLVDFQENRIEKEDLDLSAWDVFLFEGTYVALLNGLDLRICIERTYRETLQSRLLRGRDSIDRFDERILEVEHGIISSHREMADVMIDRDYSVKIVK
ncbi:MAG: hypothetical protein GF408_04885 [Candidatus Omnitrophica bacterium]|nr:hypothetical protein [Candidatus Omnitrophota bacterium]